MSRLTITVSEARYRALKAAAAQRGRTIGRLVEESLEFYGIKSREDARDLVRRARAQRVVRRRRARAGGRAGEARPARRVKPAAFVVDTNVVVAGLLTLDAASPVARALDGMLAAAFPFAVSEALLAEYRAVLARPPIRARHGLDDEGIDLLLTELVRHAIVLEPGQGIAAPDPRDQLLWDLLASRTDLARVTGDRVPPAMSTAPAPILTMHVFAGGDLGGIPAMPRRSARAVRGTRGSRVHGRPARAPPGPRPVRSADRGRAPLRYR